METFRTFPSYSNATVHINTCYGLWSINYRITAISYIKQEKCLMETFLGTISVDSGHKNLPDET